MANKSLRICGLMGLIVSAEFLAGYILARHISDLVQFIASFLMCGSLVILSFTNKLKEPKNTNGVKT